MQPTDTRWKTAAAPITITLSTAAEYLRELPDENYVDDDPHLARVIMSLNRNGKERLSDDLDRAVADFAEAQHRYNNVLSKVRAALDPY